MTQPNGSDDQPTRERYPLAILGLVVLVVAVIVTLALCGPQAPERQAPAPELLAPTPLPTAVLS